MSEREARVEMVAGVLRDAIFRRGKNWLKAADEVLDALDKEAEYEYNIETLDLVTGHTHVWRERWEPDTEWLQKELDKRDEYDRKLLNIPGGGPLEYTRRLVKRRKAGRIEDV